MSAGFIVPEKKLTILMRQLIRDLVKVALPLPPWSALSTSYICCMGGLLQCCHCAVNSIVD